jgi:carbon monoxide dehydrogenase subunit G
MIVEGAYRFAGRREVVWQMLLDPAMIGKTMPGVQQLVRLADGRYQGKMRVGVGSFATVDFDVTVTLTDVVAPERYTMRIDGRGRLGYARGSAQVRLSPDAAGPGTTMQFKADLEVGGGIAVLGRRVLDTVSGRIMRQGLEGLAREVGRRLGSAAGSAGPAPA